MNREMFYLDEISIRGISLDLLRSFWMIILAAVSVWLLATGIHNFIYVPEYTASATLVVTVKGESSAYTSLSTAVQMADVFGEVFQSDALRSRITEDVGEEIQGDITCSPISETNLLTLRTTCPDPRQAYLFINSALKNYEEVAEDVFSNASLQIVQEPQVPSSPSNSSWLLSRRYLLTALGGMGMAAVICLLYVFRFTVKNTAFASRQLDGTIRGVIPFERKRFGGKKGRKQKQSLLLNSPAVSMDFAESSRKIGTKVEYHMHRNKQQVLLVTSVSENEGKSTVAANIALTLGEKHKKVLLVDGDLRKPAQYKVFEDKSKNKNSLDKVLSGKVSWKEAVEFRDRDNIWKLFQYHGIADPEKVMRNDVLKKLIGEWKQEMDYIVIDCSPTAVSTDAEIWMEEADTVLLVVRQDWSDARVINDVVDMVWQSSRDFSGFVLNAFHEEWTKAQREYGYGDYRRSRGEERG